MARYRATLLITVPPRTRMRASTAGVTSARVQAENKARGPLVSDEIGQWSVRLVLNHSDPYSRTKEYLRT